MGEVPRKSDWRTVFNVQDGRVLRPATRRKLLDGKPLSADSRPHRATRVASDVIERTASGGERRMRGARVSLRWGSATARLPTKRDP